MGFGAASAPTLPISAYYVIYWVPAAVALCFFIVRLAVKMVGHGTPGLQLDDIFVTFAAAAVIAMSVIHTVMTPISVELGLLVFGLVQPGPNFMADTQRYLRLQFTTITLFWNVLWAVKFSLLIFIWRLTEGLPTMRRWWWGVLGFNIIMWISAILSQYLNCRPLSTAFKIGPEACESLHPGTSARALLYAMIADITTDLTIIALPLRLLWGLKINRKQKMGLVLIFSLGVLCIIFAIVRGVGSIVDQAIIPIWLVVWTQSEACVALIVACLPSLRTLLLNRAASGGSPQNSLGYRYGSRKFALSESSYSNGSRANQVQMDDVSDASHITRIEASHMKQPQVSGMYVDGNDSTEEMVRPRGNNGVAVHTNISITTERAHRAKESF
ncbi:hypothetical protein Dda_6598 [Drechslerella dactyloides]|uniref:Rhodopsin domain-containing protein n=1 Tax=Drechslerella dactyloides TaxID=74499 RepID=A0AAD6ITV3_DREDA|nr:hypothetical protein Dda_6598 [Drechslerella dactyloides]